MTRAQAKPWSRRSLAKEALVSSRIYTVEIVDRILVHIPRSLVENLNAERGLIWGIVHELELDIVRLDRPTAGNKRAALKSLRSKLQGAITALSEIDDDSRRDLEAAAAADPHEFHVDLPREFGADHGYLRLKEVEALLGRMEAWSYVAISTLSTDEHTGGKRRLDPERLAIARLFSVWSGLRARHTKQPTEAQLTVLAREAFGPLFAHYGRTLPDLTRAAHDVIYAPNWRQWPGQERFEDRVRQARHRTNGVQSVGTPLVKPSRE